MFLQKRNILLVELFLERFRRRGNHHPPSAANRRQQISQRFPGARAGLHNGVMMRFERIVYHFRHFQLPGPMFVVGADRGGVKPALHAFFEESSRAKHLRHRRFRRFLSGRRGVILEGHIPALGSLCRTLDLRSHRIGCRIGCTLGQKSAFSLTDRNRGTSYDNIPFAFASSAAHPWRLDLVSLDSGPFRTEQVAFTVPSRSPTALHSATEILSVFLSRGRAQTNLSWGAT